MAKSEYPHGKHPNSLKQLTGKLGQDEESKQRAREMQAKGLETRRKNKELRESLKMTAGEFKKFKNEILDGGFTISAIDVLRMNMMKAFHADDMDTANQLALAIAEFETPKLTRTEAKVETIEADKLSDEDLDAKLAEFAKLRAVK